ncbi:MAG TPA: LytTR family transcriptional regulator DNA-binding domain-containing protein [Pyrinomonadaceae bacterium]|jgi:two-component system LytT family response regulator
MPEIKTIVVDDEPLARRGLRQLLASHADFKVIAESRNGVEAISAVRSLHPDLLFLDVQMPEPDGFGVLKEIGPSLMPLVIFVTAYDEFAVRAFDAYALDYLVKPIQEKRFSEAVERVRERIRSNEAVAMSARVAELLEEQRREAFKQRVLVPTSSGELLLDASEIDWIEADDYYAAIHAGNRRHLIRESLLSLETRLDPAQFVRTHRSAIVNIARVREVRNEATEMVLVLRDGQSVPVSRRRREFLKERLKNI